MHVSRLLATSALLVAVATAAISWGARPKAQKPQKVRLARIVVDSTQLASYKALLKEGVEAAMRTEPGVLSLYAVFEKKKPNHLTILEVYANEAAYQAHLKTPHFLKYKQGTQAMVQELELIDTNPLIPELKIK
ncbi:antibiotic biosynthesis monooxygenase [Hymenobacter ginsengisoli]|uniref:Antibiotic biosynthesis monooxygenase n=1 Tax=Hymenobacter ginsengisoli TaxID=1051626 RepID=A0ABP8QF27_9BACT|nr:MULTISPECIES: putative quinol monooxygenase [unclassified Hymenobacter]MBO2032085.1 antibiotic biosynthesis monooxygenase [Hymenobacter sp. BT559]